MLVLSELCKKITVVSSDVMEEFNGNPFHNLKVFQHFLAAKVASLGDTDGHANDPTFLFHTEYSQLRMRPSSSASCIIVNYSSGIARQNLKSPPQKKQDVTPVIARNCFFGAFLHIKNKQKFLGTINACIDECMGHNASNFKKQYKDQMAMGQKVQTNHIILLQAYILFFYRNKGTPLCPSHGVDLSLYSELVEVIFPSNSNIKDANKKIGFRLDEYRMSLTKLTEAPDLTSLKVKIKEWHWGVSDELVDVATRFLKPPSQLSTSPHHEEAWVQPAATDEVFHTLAKIQEEKAGIGFADVTKGDVAIASAICSMTGFLSGPFITLIKDMKAEFNATIKDYHDEVTKSGGEFSQHGNKKCQAFVARFWLPKNNMRFNFQPK
jgi:hypothetical protein